MGNTFTNLLYHAVFSTKDREPLIGESWQDDLYAYMGGIVRGARGSLLKSGGVAFAAKTAGERGNRRYVAATQGEFVKLGARVGRVRRQVRLAVGLRRVYRQRIASAVG